ncbi:DNA repair protein RecO [uncultured Mesonia sp.]|uniref:DNA repair protein RecO n=1 Tax=uncultured Mesonia sp. TaxID=399731 RepID=UPI00374EE5F1
MLIKTKLIVLHSLRFGEADLIVRCFTKEKGSLSFLLKGVLKSKKGKLKSSLFQPLHIIDAVIQYKEGRKLSYFREAKIDFPYKSIPTNIFKSSIALFLAELIGICIQEEEQNPSLYHFLEEQFIALDQSDQFVNFHLKFMVDFTKYLGFLPQKGNLQEAYFNLEEGQFQATETNNYCLQNDNTKLLQQLLQENREATQQFNLNQNRRQEFIQMMLLYYQLHLSGFRKPKSLEVLNQLF